MVTDFSEKNLAVWKILPIFVPVVLTNNGKNMTKNLSIAKMITRLLTIAVMMATLTACEQAATEQKAEDLNRLLDRTAAVSSGDIVMLLQAGEQLVAKEAVVVPDGKKLIIK